MCRTLYISLDLNQIFIFSNKVKLSVQWVKITIHPISHPLPSNWMNELTDKRLPCQQPKLTTFLPCHNIHVYSTSILIKLHRDKQQPNFIYL